MLISPRSTAPLMPDVRDLLGDEADDAAEREWTGEMRDEDAEGAAAAPPPVVSPSRIQQDGRAWRKVPSVFKKRPRGLGLTHRHGNDNER